MITVGVIGALGEEVEALIHLLEDAREEQVGSVTFFSGRLFDKRVVVARCGVGKVFAAMCAEAMIIKYKPDLIINTGVGGALAAGLRPLDTVVAERLVQHDMDTSALGDPKGMISGINRVYFETDKKAREILLSAGAELSLSVRLGTVASGDRFVSSGEDKAAIVREFSADVCEMEGAAIAQVAYINATPCIVIRAISDSADGSSAMDYLHFLPKAAKNSSSLTERLIKEY